MPDIHPLEKMSNQLAVEVRTRAQRLALHLTGGRTPPWQRSLAEDEALRQYLLLAPPRASLLPDEAAEADALWQARFAGRPREDVAEWCLAMEHLRLRQAPLAQEEVVMTSA